MIRRAILLSLFLPAFAAASNGNCGTAPTLAPLPASVPAPEMARSLPAPASCVDSNAFLARLRLPPAPVVMAAHPALPQSGAYVPKTKDDNSPWRFDMNQNGRRMTAEEFDAWMKAKGIRVATGKPDAAATPSATPAAASAQCAPSASVQC